MAIQDELPKSRLTLTYKTEVEGEPETVNLPMRLMVMGDFSLGTSKDRKVDLDERRLRSLDGRNTDGIMKDMGMKIKMTVPNKIDPAKDEDMEVEIPITKMRSFNPDEIANNIPKVRSLQLLKKLLLEAQSNLSNKKEFRNLLAELYANPESYQKVLGELKGYDAFKLPGKDGEGKGDDAKK